jgi:hypothetical protein
LIDPTYADRLRATIARKIKLRGAFTSQGLTEDIEREIYKARCALRALPFSAATRSGGGVAALDGQLDKLNEGDTAQTSRSVAYIT